MERVKRFKDTKETMRSGQWMVLGWFFLLLSMWFMYVDVNNICLPTIDTLTGYSVASCMLDELFDILIYTLTPLGIVFMICAGIERKHEKRRH